MWFGPVKWSVLPALKGFIACTMSAYQKVSVFFVQPPVFNPRASAQPRFPYRSRWRRVAQQLPSSCQQLVVYECTRSTKKMKRGAVNHSIWGVFTQCFLNQTGLSHIHTHWVFRELTTCCCCLEVSHHVKRILETKFTVRENCVFDRRRELWWGMIIFTAS